MSRRKSFSLLLALLLVVSVFTACTGGNNAANESSSSTNQPATDTPKEEEKPSWQTEKITLKFASWETPEMEAKLLEAFMQKHPNITVEKDSSINWPWTDSLTAAASAGNLPDVFWVENVPVGVENDWLYDLTELWDADEETKAIYPNIAKQAVYGGKRLASPTFQFIMGVFVNKTLLEKNNIPLPGYDWTIDEMIGIAKKVSNPAEHIYGIGGPWGNLSFDEHWPALSDASMGNSTFDGEKFHFTNQQWIDGYNQKLELRRLKVEEKMTGEEKKAVFGDEGAWPMQKGHVALGIDGSWNMAALGAQMEKDGAGKLDFYPYPRGKAGQRMPIVLDYIGISSTTKHPEAAYELMKFMTWSKEGWLTRLDLNKELNIDIDKFPVAEFSEVWEKMDGQLKMEGVKAAIKLFDQAVPGFGKTLPGWREYNVWLNDEQKLSEKFVKGELKPADKAKEMEDKANEFVSQAMQRINQ
ncbi:extracellular solute-binding protein [Paenibacillus sp. MER TA 81-3]|uniref:extracellular solute-binding protein n=1 Tax=Paenibacillus sp. MER TA 81-3 TaxID=2939573 RepID=UPI0020420A38|nr:extracellular solute-binding protein [Paenibacillus sp. MER TA 81-3]MCM3337641.1 extracellular solute-binding protein [Paenibacillus sp. MER TA 81-3]